jgi:elongation factor P--(R)-beta-lysine ligase
MGSKDDATATVGPQDGSWWNPQRHRDRRPLLLARGRIQMALRGYFAAEGFTEVETAQLQISPGNETHLHGVRADLRDEAGAARRRYLHTSPEFAMKKLLAAGETKIFSFARVFRDRETSRTHSPEFTMLEWYRVGEPYEALMADCAVLLRLAAEAAGTARLRHRGLEADPFAAPERLTLAEAFQRESGIDLLATNPGGIGNRDALAAAASACGIGVVADDRWSDLFSKVLSDRIERKLGLGRSTILCEYPASEAALARVSPSDPRIAERFELYACGVELANAFRELTDPLEQRKRFEADMDEKERLYGERYPIDEDFLAALAVMPEASGAALGFDRLVMLATGAGRIDEVLWTPV